VFRLVVVKPGTRARAPLGRVVLLHRKKSRADGIQQLGTVYKAALSAAKLAVFSDTASERISRRRFSRCALAFEQPRLAPKSRPLDAGKERVVLSARRPCPDLGEDHGPGHRTTARRQKKWALGAVPKGVCARGAGRAEGARVGLLVEPDARGNVWKRANS